MLIIKAVEMDTGVSHTKGEFTQACRDVLLSHSDVIKCVRMESVSSGGYAEYLKAQGWTVAGPFYTGMNADLCVQ